MQARRNAHYPRMKASENRDFKDKNFWLRREKIKRKRGAKMRWAVFALFLVLGLLCRQSSSSHAPTKESLCGLIVDTSYQDRCLQCFTEAGPLEENPEGFRHCVATYLPPLTAECAVPHPNTRKVARIDQYKPEVHHNHTNANLLPSCLRRRMRDLSRYLKKENRFAQQAGMIVKTVVESTLIPSGGMNMLNIMSQRYILCLPAVKDLVMFGAQSCLEGYDYSCESQRSSLGDDSLESDEEEEGDGDSKAFTDDDEDDESDEDYDYDDEGVKRNSWERALKVLKSDSLVKDDVDSEEELRARPPTRGNGLPYGGTNELSQEMIVGKCIIDVLNEKKLTIHLISVIAQDEFFYPIPNMWVEPILRFYKAYREELENEESGR